MAKQSYAGKLQIRFTCSTNGLTTYGTDMQIGTEGNIVAYPTPDGLWAMVFAEEKNKMQKYKAIYDAKKIWMILQVSCKRLLGFKDICMEWTGWGLISVYYASILL